MHGQQNIKITLYMFRTVSPSIISSLRLYIQHMYVCITLPYRCDDTRDCIVQF